MRIRLFAALCCAALASVAARAQVLDNAALSGKYFFVQLLADSPAGQPVAARNLGGSITFDGKGAYGYSGKLGVGAAAATAASGQGVYRVADSGSLTLTNPIRGTLEVRGWLGCAGSGAGSLPGGCGDLLIVGASTEAADSSYDFFLAIRAPTGTAGAALLNGAYTAASLRLADSGAASALLSLAANGNGQFTSLTVLGHATDQGGTNAGQPVSGATYTLNADGTGAASFGSTSTLVSGSREIFISPDGAYLIGYSSAAGPRDVVVGVKNYSGSAAAANFEGDYRIAELTVETLANARTAFDGATFSAGSGTVRALGNGRALLSERLRVLNTRMDYSGVNSYQVSTDGGGALAPKLAQDLKNMALGPAVNLGTVVRAASLAGAQVGLAGKASYQYGIFFAARAPALSGAGVFLHPNGVVNAASFAPAPAPVCPGAIVSLFGSAFAGDKAVATSLPLPTVLGGLTVTVGGTQGPLFYVSPGQVNLQIPYGLKGSSVSLKAGTGTAASSEVTVPLAATCPGVFFYDDGQSLFRGVVLHADYSLVTAGKPARLGETVLIYLTGLGELSPAATTGAANPESPPGKALDPAIAVYFGGEAALGVAFAGGAPRFAGLNQINVTIPFSAPTGSGVPVAIATSTAYTDVVDIPISY
jgi:uncharacterized protein (TIGR03437 family)